MTAAVSTSTTDTTAAQRDRLTERFAKLKAENRGGLVIYTMAGDPDRDSALKLMKGLPEAGADVIELGMPFSDPMADGPAIQAAALRSLAGGMTLTGTLDTLAAFREGDDDTPVVLMGYYNPIYQYGVERFAAKAREAGADGLIIVDLPPEEAPELNEHLDAHGIHLIFLTTPTTKAERLPMVLREAGGFLYYVSITGITGSASAVEDEVAAAIADLRSSTDLPIAVGFGIKTPEQAAGMARIADAAVVGSAVVNKVAENLGDPPAAVDAALALVKQLSESVRAARA
ncbi:Tryptophan synthase alpha chain [Caenispirillum salinarum AK4]|uniref:Tryptophan synthase alpha chain n=1 Tax=Caenispirillum salinarum AK4 TaxID=1238182 RepID=K9HBZ2_9PROT|nr:tryptophan synthase subunit alpha [Caenispirillum salinarum]EKV28063.1 Tryptophan synthase alpha chain [Caenispirillum salinarum AK4]